MGACMSKQYTVILPDGIRVWAENEEEARNKALSELAERFERLFVYEEKWPCST